MIRRISSGRQVSRRRFLLGAGAASAAVLSACVVQPPPAQAPSTQPTAPAVQTEVKPTDAPTAFPVTIAHKFGSTTIAQEPKRVIALGYSDQDPILALGVKPIATRFWWGDEKMAAFPWAQDKLGDAKPEVLNMNELNFEKIAALKPDLIVATYAGIKDKEYATLSKIAPTLAQSGEYLDYGMPWQEVTLMIGKALGQEAKAKTLAAEIEGRFEAIRAKHPEYAGKSVIIGVPYEDKFGFMASQDPRSRMFAALGFKVPEEFDKIAGNSFYGQISAERIDLLNTDLLVFHQLQWVKGGRAAIEADPLLSKVTTLKEGHAVFLEGELDDAFQFNSVLSLPLVLDQLLPKLEAAMGDKQRAAAAPVATFPRTLKDAAGIEVTIPAEPKRVVCLQNLWDLDAVLSLGIAPTQFGIRSFAGQYTGSEQVSWKWHEDTIKKLGGDAKRVNGDETNIETVVVAKPDLIVGMQWSLEKSRDQLSKVAPVIQLVTDWRESLKIVGDAFGQPEKAAKIIADTDARIANSIKDLNLGKKTVAVISCYDNTKFYGFGHPADGRADLFLRAGFSFLDSITSKSSAETSRPEFSIELLNILDPADVVVLFDYGSDGTKGSGILENPLFTRIPAVKAGKLLVFKQGELAQGMSTISPININFCLEAVREAAKLAVKV